MANEITFTEIEREILRTLHENRGTMVKVATILERAWGGVADPDPLWVKPHMSRIRRKVAIVRPGWQIKAGYGGKGYRLDISR